MKVSLNDVERDLIQLCEDNEVMAGEIKKYFAEFENKDYAVLDLRDE